MVRSPRRSRVPDPAVPEASPRAGREAELALAAVVALAFAAHVTFARHAGGFWRDEANTLAFASMTSVRELFASLAYDSAPPTTALLVRAAMALGAHSDGALRAVGAAVGLGALAALIAGARSLGARLPVATLALFALNAWVVRGGDALRPQGLAMLGVTLAFVAAARVALAPGRRRIAIAAAASAFAALCAWTVLPLLGAIAAALLAVAVRERSRARAAGSVAIAAAAAIAVLPFASDLRAASVWGALVRTGADLSSLPAALGSSTRHDLLLWTLFVSLGLAAGAIAWRAPRIAPSSPLRTRDALLAPFALVALVAGAAASLSFLHWSALPTQPWYHLPLLALACLSLDLLLAPWVRRPGVLEASAAAVALLAAAHGYALYDKLLLRTTNVNLLAERLERLAAPGDFLVVTPWQLGVSYTRVAAAGLEWSTLPPLADTRIHRYDLVREAMLRPEDSDAVNARALATLAAGHRVFVLGALPPMNANAAAPMPPAAPSAALGWNSDAYTLAWTRHFVADLLPSLRDARPVAGSRTNVSPYEDATLYVLESTPRPETPR
jgi:hypothetical protein